MFDRKKYKSFALKMLKGRWIVPVLMTLCIIIISLIFQIPQLIQTFHTDEGQKLITGNYESINEFYELYYLASNSRGSEILSIISSIVTSIFVMASLSVYLKLTRSPEKVSFSSFIEGFNNCIRAALCYLWKLLWVLVWSFFFIIPGIIKAISYSQMEYIINEFENVSVTKAMKISMIITRGHLMDLFVLGLSFIGWGILSTLTLGIGFLWLIPYQQTTYMNTFHALLKEALEDGRIKPEDLQ